MAGEHPLVEGAAAPPRRAAGKPVKGPGVVATAAIGVWPRTNPTMKLDLGEQCRAPRPDTAFALFGLTLPTSAA